MNILLNLRYFTGIAFIQAFKKKIKLVKELFVLEIEKGNEVLIPKGLSQDKLPYAFRFYDPIIKICKTNMNIQRKEFYGVKQQFMADMNTGNFAQQLEEVFGMKAGKEMVQKQIPINEKIRKEIEIYTNPHVRQIQRSKYVAIDEGNPGEVTQTEQLSKQLMINGFPLFMKDIGILEAKIDICFKKTDLVSAK